MVLPEEIQAVLADRESGSIALLTRLESALATELQQPGRTRESFTAMVEEVRMHLVHFAAIDNFLLSLTDHIKQEDGFPGSAIGYLSEYGEYWRGSSRKITENFLRNFDPEGKTILTHSHSQTVLSLLEQLHAKQIGFRVLQTLSIPGEEGRIAVERLHRQQITADLVEDSHAEEVMRNRSF
jgi:translation initiation factor 2B subunit (eIF-2B alpha/beta/delta family)